MPHPWATVCLRACPYPNEVVLGPLPSTIRPRRSAQVSLGTCRWDDALRTRSDVESEQAWQIAAQDRDAWPRLESSLVAQVMARRTTPVHLVLARQMITEEWDTHLQSSGKRQCCLTLGINPWNPFVSAGSTMTSLVTRFATMWCSRCMLIVADVLATVWMRWAKTHPARASSTFDRSRNCAADGNL